MLAPFFLKNTDIDMGAGQTLTVKANILRKKGYLAENETVKNFLGVWSYQQQI